MSPQTQEKFKAAMQNNVTQMAQFPSAYQKYATQAQQDMSALDPSKVYFLFQNGGMVVYATPLNGPPSVSRILNLMVPTTKGAASLMLNQVHLADTVQKLGEAAPEEWKRLAAYQRSRVWPNTLPALMPDDHSAWHPAISRAAQTDWLGEQGHMEYVSDYYSHGGYSIPDAQKRLPVKRPLAAELDEMAAKRDVSWTKDADGIYLVRNNRWYRDDGLEVPEPLLRRWFGAMLQARREAAAPAVPQSQEERVAALKQTLAWAMEVFNTLTPWQMRNGLTLFQPEEKDLAAQNDATAATMYAKLKHSAPNGVVPPGFDAFTDMTRRPPFLSAVNVFKGFPHTVQFYGSLDDTRQTALLEGSLPASALSEAQLTQATLLQPLLPMAIQHFPLDAVRLSLLSGSPDSSHVAFGMAPRMRLEVSTPTPPSTP